MFNISTTPSLPVGVLLLLEKKTMAGLKTNGWVGGTIHYDLNSPFYKYCIHFQPSSADIYRYVYQRHAQQFIFCLWPLQRELPQAYCDLTSPFIKKLQSFAALWGCITYFIHWSITHVKYQKTAEDYFRYAVTIVFKVKITILKIFIKDIIVKILNIYTMLSCTNL